MARLFAQAFSTGSSRVQGLLPRSGAAAGGRGARPPRGGTAVESPYDNNTLANWTSGEDAAAPGRPGEDLPDWLASEKALRGDGETRVPTAIGSSRCVKGSRWPLAPGRFVATTAGHCRSPATTRRAASSRAGRSSPMHPGTDRPPIWSATFAPAHPSLAAGASASSSPITYLRQGTLHRALGPAATDPLKAGLAPPRGAGAPSRSRGGRSADA